jgi:Helix-turn-helix domain
MNAPALPRPLTGADAELRHGYTIAEVSRLSMRAVRRERWHQAADFDDRLEVAWHAIIEHIYTAAEPPAERDVMYAGWRAIGELVSSDYQFRGHNRQDRYAGTIAGFERYWWTTARATPGPEERVTERVALGQIWPLLRPLHREVLTALAAHEDYGLAAAALGKSRKTFTTQVGEARRAFLELWHQGEAPSRPWGYDRRRTTTTNAHSVTNRAVVARARVRTRHAVRNGGQLPPARRTGPPWSDLGISNAELVRRYEGGQSIRQLAVSLGSSYSVIHRRLQAEGAQLRSTGHVRRQVRADPGGTVPTRDNS